MSYMCVCVCVCVGGYLGRQVLVGHLGSESLGGGHGMATRLVHAP